MDHRAPLSVLIPPQNLYLELTKPIFTAQVRISWFCTGFSRTCTPQFITIYRLSVCLSVCLSGLNSKFAMIKGFWVQFLQKSKLELKLNMTVVRENPVLPLGTNPFNLPD
jgi:hypothetical protein